MDAKLKKNIVLVLIGLAIVIIFIFQNNKRQAEIEEFMKMQAAPMQSAPVQSPPAKEIKK